MSNFSISQVRFSNLLVVEICHSSIVDIQVSGTLLCIPGTGLTYTPHYVQEQRMCETYGRLLLYMRGMYVERRVFLHFVSPRRR